MPRKLRVSFAFVVVFVTYGLLAQAEETADLAGPAFSSTRQIVDVPKGWQDQVVEHDASLRDVDLVVNLDQSEYPFLHTIIEDYAKNNGLKIFVNSGTCGVSSQMLRHKTVDVASFCCPLGKDDYLPGVQFTTLGIAPLLLIVHPDNPVDNLTIDQARYAFAGELKRWSSLAANAAVKQFDYPIQPLAFIHCKKRPGHWRLIIGDEEWFSVRLQTVLTVPEMIESVATLKNGIGYEVPMLVKYYRQERGQVKHLKINGYDPAQLTNLASLDYPFYRVFSLATWKDKPNAEAQKLVTYLIAYFAEHGEAEGFLPAQKLRDAGWQFVDQELVGEPVASGQ